MFPMSERAVPAVPAARVVRRPATADEAKAMAHPMRLRILRLCLNRELTNKELADRLGRDPGTLLHHVRILVKAGFLAPGDPRHGSHGALEKPYRATGKSWLLDFGDRATTEDPAASPSLEAFRAELAEAGPGSMEQETRIGLTLTDDSLRRLQERLQDIFDEYVDRPPDPGGNGYGLYLAIHRQRVTEG
jgi:DNA-binding transcriptional ArsR family regulator